MHQSILKTTSTPLSKAYQKYLCYAAMAGCYVYLLAKSWCKWGDIVTDTFNDQVIALKLNEGGILYRDIDYLFGPLPPYLLALMNKSFGTTLYCSVGLGIFISILCSIAIYRTSRLYLSRSFSCMAVLSFLFLSAFSSTSMLGIFNFILPYSLATTLTIMFILCGVYFFLKYILSGRTPYLWGWITSQYLMFLSRPDITIPVFACFAVCGTIWFFGRKEMKKAAWLVLPLFAAGATYFIYLAASNSLTPFSELVLRTMIEEGTGKRVFAFSNLGVYEIEYLSSSAARLAYVLPFNIIVMLKSFFFQLLLIFIFVFAGREMFRLEQKYIKSATISVLWWAAFTGASFLLLNSVIRPLQIFQFRPLPLFLAAGIIISLARYKHDPARYLSLIALMSVSLAFLARIIFKADANLYGVFFIVPGAMAYYVVIADLIPSCAGKYFPADGGRRYFTALVFVLMALFAYPYVKYGFFWYSARTAEIPTTRGRMLAPVVPQAVNWNVSWNIEVPSSKGQMYTPAVSRPLQFCEVLEYMSAQTPADATLIVLPEGLGINYLAGRRCPVKYYTYLPPLSKDYEGLMLESFRSSPADYIILLHRPCFEQGFSFFGRDYGFMLHEWILENYEPVRQFGVYPGSGALVDFGALIMKRKSGKPPSSR